MNNIRFESQVCKYLPTWYQDISDYKEICKAESAQMAIAEALTKRVYGNFYFSTMDGTALAEWEELFGIIADPTETIAFRRDRILNRLSMKPPYTIKFLQAQLDKLIGAGNYNLIVDAQNFTIYVESAAESQAYAIEVNYTLNNIKPAHIVYINVPFIEAGVLAGESIGKSEKIYNYRLGAWGLGLQPFASNTTMEVIKVATTPSIQGAFLEDIATFSLGDIAKARVNGSVVITDLTKEQDGNIITVEYTVNPSDTSEVSTLELLDASDVVLTRSTVYIPIVNTTILKHTIKIAEGTNGN